MLVLLRYLKYKFIDAPDPSHELFHYASRVTLVSLVGVIAYVLLPIEQVGWLLASAVFANACFRGRTRVLQSSLLLCSSLYFLAISFFITILAQSIGLFLLFMVIVVLLGYRFISINADIGLVIVLNIIMTLLIGGFPGDEAIAWHRLIATAMGIVIAVAGAYLIFPYSPPAIIKRLNHIIEQKNIFYLQWVFTDCICGNISSQRLDSFRQEILVHIQETWQILKHYPDPSQLKLLNDHMDFFGQIAVLARLLFEPMQQNSLIRFFSPLEELRKDFFDLSKEKYDNSRVTQGADQKIMERLKQLEQQHPDNQDIQSVCFALERLSNLIIQGKVDETSALA